MLGVSWMTLTNSKEGFLCLMLGFLLDGLCILEEALSAYMGNFHLNSVCIFIYRVMCIIGVFKVDS